MMNHTELKTIEEIDFETNSKSKGENEMDFFDMLTVIVIAVFINILAFYYIIKGAIKNALREYDREKTRTEKKKTVEIK